MLDLTTRQLLQDTAAACFSPSSDGAGPAALGWIGLLTPAELGGEGWLPAEAALIALETGRQNAPSTWALSAATAAVVASCDAPEHIVEPLLSGELAGTLCIAADERWEGSRLAPGTVLEVLSDRPPDVIVVFDRSATRAQLVMVSADRCAPLSGDDALETIRQSFQVELGHDAPVLLDAEPGQGPLSACRVLVDADTVGALGAALSMVMRHLVEREAFGVPVASFQVIQHRLVDWTVFERAAEALVQRAAGSLAAKVDSDAERLVAALHAYVEGRAVKAIDDLIQLAGAMGFTWEYPLHHHLRRVATNASLLSTGRMSRSELVMVARRAGS